MYLYGKFNNNRRAEQKQRRKYNTYHTGPYINRKRDKYKKYTPSNLAT